MQVDSIYIWAKDSTLEESFSLERFQRYVEWAEGSKENAFQLYALKTASICF
jgi:hypothetical protein